MNCTEVQAELLEYLEKTLDAETLRDVESHLFSCALCRAEADGLAQCVRQVAGLPLLDPPVGFTQRVMAHVRGSEKTPRFWQLLLLPLKFKIPLHATAVVLIAILAAYLFKKEEPLQGPLTTAEQSRGVEAKKERMETTMPMSQFSPVGRDPATIRSGTEPKEDAPTLERQKKAIDRATEVQRRAQPSVAEQTTLLRDPPKAGAKEEAAIVLAPPPPPVKGMSVSDEPSRKTQPPVLEFRIIPSPTAPPAEAEGTPKSLSPRLKSSEAMIQAFDVELVVRGRSPQRGEAQGSGRLGTLRPSAEGASVVRESAPARADQMAGRRLMPNIAQSAQPQTLWLTIPTNQYEQLRKELDGIGTIESESPPMSRERDALRKATAPLRIKVTILPSNGTEDITPTTPSSR